MGTPGFQPGVPMLPCSKPNQDAVASFPLGARPAMSP